MTTLTHLECSLCKRTYEPAGVRGRCDCGGILLARYDLESTRLSWSREWLGNAPATMWRYAPLLPVANPAFIVSLGEGMTPLLRLPRLAEKLGAKDLWIKDEGVNPTASIHARGFSCAVSTALERGIRQVTITSPGDPAGALAAYAAAAGIEARVVIPPDAPEASFLECNACGATVASEAASEEWFSMGAFVEPYRLEGTKTAGFEIAEQFRWELPDAILFPTGRGGGLVGLWKAFDELEAVGWISSKRPRLISVEPQFAVPRPASSAAKPLVQQAVTASGGVSIPIGFQEMLDAGIELASTEGIFPAPEGGACVAALRRLLREGMLRPEERTVLVNTASGHKHTEVYATRFPRTAFTEADKLGGLITPR